MKKIKKIISRILICCIVTISVCQGVTLKAAPNQVININGYEIEILNNSDDKTVVKTEADGIHYELQFFKKTEEFELETKDYPVNIFGKEIGKPEVETYTINPQEGGQEEIVADIVSNDDPKDIVHVDDSMVEAQSLSLILAGGLSAAVISLLEAIFFVSATIVVLGVVYYAANKVIKALKREQPQVHYYKAVLVPSDNVFIGPKIKSKSAAATRLAAGGGVFAISSGYAYDACKSASPVKKVSKQQQHKGGGKSYKHYHPIINAKGKQSSAHCWFI
ncbi:MAG: hypothetical protein LBM02_10435 [Lachnospiraceae bacterium]|jgi:hypothetical protein|nr:hypothetical protein [Lachnospiraceae bacterium]